MCYSIAASLKTQLKRALQESNEAAVKEIIEKMQDLGLDDIHLESGFNHPKMAVFKSQKVPIVAEWGLIPSWVQNEQKANGLRNKTLNARIETVLEKPSFKEAIQYSRGVLFVDGFFENQHVGKQVVPHFIYNKDKSPLTLAVLISQYNGAQTFSIATTAGNQFMSSIHNNPKLKGPRMPLILDEQLESLWLEDRKASEIIRYFLELSEEEIGINLTAHTVAPLTGKRSKGNSPEAQLKHYNDRTLRLF